MAAARFRPPYQHASSFLRYHSQEDSALVMRREARANAAWSPKDGKLTR